MRKYIIISIAVLGSLCATTGQAQQVKRAINWKPDYETGKRYTVAIHPYHLMKSGLKIDFEKELNNEGNWLQIGLMGYITPKTDWDRDYDDWGWGYFHRGGWENLASGFDPYNKMVGGGIHIAYKYFFTNSGLYVNPGILYNYYDVDYKRKEYVHFVEGGLDFYEYKMNLRSTQFHQPAITVNFGKHMAMGRHAFLDLFVGAGYMYSFYKGPSAFTDYVGFGYRGMYFNGGGRIGVMWGKNK